jgi:two-component system, LytTR family, response regulator
MSESAITALIVDDEPLGRDLVRHMLAAHREIRVIAECSDGEKALAAIKRHAPQLVFLDVKMPRLDGIALLGRIEASARPLIIFLTAHDAYALRAFEEHALDYLLKPFDQERFDQAVARARERLAQLEAAKLGLSVKQFLAGLPAPAGATATAKPYAERIVVRENGRVYFVGVAEICWLEASGNYVALHIASGKTHLVHETMTVMETRLDPSRFVRIHRSTIVNVDRIKELQPYFNGEYIVVLKNGTNLKLSRNFLEKARATLGLE